jgi:hypothetical protein
LIAFEAENAGDRNLFSIIEDNLEVPFLNGNWRKGQLSLQLRTHSCYALCSSCSRTFLLRLRRAR